MDVERSAFLEREIDRRMVFYPDDDGFGFPFLLPLLL